MTNEMNTKPLALATAIAMHFDKTELIEMLTIESLTDLIDQMLDDDLVIIDDDEPSTEAVIDLFLVYSRDIRFEYLMIALKSVLAN